jgi:hypothetical protein
LELGKKVQPSPEKGNKGCVLGNLLFERAFDQGDKSVTNRTSVRIAAKVRNPPILLKNGVVGAQEFGC